MPEAEAGPEAKIEPGAGRIADNIVYFGRTLRRAGLPVGPAAIIDAIRAVETAGIGSRADFYWTLHSVFVKKREHRAVFHEAFELFWQQRGLLEKMLAMLTPGGPAPAEREKPRAGEARARQAMAPETQREEERPRVEVDMRMTVSSRELLQKKDFAQMSAAEIAEAKRALAMLTLPDDRLQDAPAEDCHARTLRSAPHHARLAQGGRRHHHAGLQGARRAQAADRGDLRHLRLHGAIFAADAAFPARAVGAAEGLHLPLRHAAHQRHAPAAAPRPGRGAGAAARTR